jgi:hypothetical protein
MYNLTLKILLNRLHRFKGFCYVAVGFNKLLDTVLEIHVRARKGSRGVCSGCGLAGATYDH